MDEKICEWLFINHLLLSEGESLLSAFHLGGSGWGETQSLVCSSLGLWSWGHRGPHSALDWVKDLKAKTCS